MMNELKRCSHRGSERAASCVNTDVERFKDNRCMHRSSSVYHRHPEFYPEKVVFRAKPVPAHTYQSSAQLIKIQKRAYVREIKPFSFYERGQEIEKRKVERFLKVLEEEKKMRECKARPVPTWLFKTTMSTPDFRNLQAQMQRKTRQIPKTQAIRTKNQAKIEQKKPIFNAIDIANQAGDSKATQKGFDKKDWKQQPIRERKKLCLTVPVQKKVPSTVPTQKKEPPMMPGQKKVPLRVPVQKKIPSKFPAQKKGTNFGTKESIPKSVLKSNKDRKVILVRSKTEQNIAIKPEANQTKRSFKIKQTTSEIFPNRSNIVKATDMDKPVEKRRVVSSKVSEKIQKFELKKKPTQKEKFMTQRKVVGAHQNTTVSNVKNSNNAKFNQRKKAHKSANLHNNEIEVIPAVPRNSLETLGTHSKNDYEDLQNSSKNTFFVNKSSIDYSHFFEELKTMNNTLKSDSPLMQKVFTDVISKQDSEKDIIHLPDQLDERTDTFKPLKRKMCNA
uniref:Uncharacterized protein n=1 Tax=Cacopsylla melanoneura TaxID=428564 RepID=A0A8D8T3S4_9HEMI